VQVHYGLDNFEAKRPVVTIGTFDGVHLGHREVIAELKRIARETGGESVVFTFFPHPRMVVTPNEDTIRLLTTQEEKCILLEELMLDRLVIYPFTREFASLTYSEFVKNILVDQMQICKLVTGYDHKFGHDRQGDFQSLKILGDLYGFEVEQLSPMLVENVAVSSTKIRQALETGDVKKVSHYLGYPYLLKGKVVEGRRLGREIGFPTANIQPDDQHKLIPTNGVYAVWVKVGEGRYKGMLNVGTRPTVNTNVDHRSIEVHILDFLADIYQCNISVSFVERIRNEVKFGSLDQLKAQLELDKTRTLSIFADLI
jgi:riboflavin kinase/FMN adenylyltransferase